MRSPELQKRFGERGIEMVASRTPDECAAVIRAETARYVKLAREAKIQAD